MPLRACLGALRGSPSPPPPSRTCACVSRLCVAPGVDGARLRVGREHDGRARLAHEQSEALVQLLREAKRRRARSRGGGGHQCDCECVCVCECECAILRAKISTLFVNEATPSVSSNHVQE
eukprot:282761-Pleurochrysis_carterae.AAC.1